MMLIIYVDYSNNNNSNNSSNINSDSNKDIVSKDKSVIVV